MDRGLVLATAGEQSWHRRARRSRQAARAILAVATARETLLRHHGGGMGGASKGGGKGGGGQRKEGWKCPKCAYHNFGHRVTCRVCLERGAPTISTAPRNRGAGGKGGGSATSATSSKDDAWAVGGIAQRQLQQEREAARRRQSELDSLRHVHKKTVERLQVAEAAVKAASNEEDTAMDDDGTETEDIDSRIKALSTQLVHAEALLKCLDDTAAFPDLPQRVAGLKEQIADLEDKRTGPEAKLLGKAGKHAKDLRNARGKFIRKQKARARLEEELEGIDKELAATQRKREEKQRELDEVKLEASQAQAEVERLSKSSEAEPAAADAEPALGPRERTRQLAEQLAVHIGNHPARGVFDDLIRQIIAHKEAQHEAADTLRKDAPSLPPQSPTPPPTTTPTQSASGTASSGQPSPPPAEDGAPAAAAQQGSPAAAPKDGGGGPAKGSGSGAADIGRSNNDSEEELVDDAMDVEVEEALALLSPQQGDMLRRRITSRGPRGSERAASPKPPPAEQQQRDRERSPRPTKGGNRDC